MFDPLPMADDPSFSDDISNLWGPDVEGGLTPASPTPAPIEHHKENGNGTRRSVALAANHGDVVRRADLDAARAEMEEAFTHRIAVALYEAGRIGDVTAAALSTLRDEVASLRQEITELRTAMDAGTKARGRRWNRSR